MTDVNVTKNYPYPAQFVWRFLSDFFTPWHPMMEWCEKVDSKTRRFGMPGEDGAYVERLTNFDPDERLFEYKMLEGIDGINSYRGSAFVESLGDGESLVVWQAHIVAPSGIGERVAAGTAAVFKAGLDELEKIMATALTIKTEMIETDGEPTLAVDTAGAGELMLFLHGIGGNRSNWHAQLNALSYQFQTAALDFRGYGASELTAKSPELAEGSLNKVTVEDHINDISRVLAHFRAESVHLVGLSYGSWLAACFAQTHPDKIKTLTLCAGSTGMSEASDEERKRFEELRLKPMEAGQTPADIAKGVVEVLSGPESTNESRQQLFDSMVAIPQETYVAALRCFLNPPYKINFETFDFPTLFIAGEHDKLASPAEMGGIAMRVPNAELAVISGAGHLINIEKPSAFSSQLSAWQHKLTAARS
ncbi:MAG: alpha/beta fold hydrolase [Chloroflexota bacterium]